MSLRDKAAVAAEQSSTALQLDRTQLRKGVRWEASQAGRSLGVCTVYPDGIHEGWTVDGTSHTSLWAWLEMAYVIANGKRQP
jgi:hypothetical protein